MRLRRLEQPHVLDRNHRLVGEGGDQLDLAVGECLDFALPQRDDAAQSAFAQQRHRQHGAHLGNLLDVRDLVVRVGADVENLHRAQLHEDAAGRGSSSGGNQDALPRLERPWRHVVGGDGASAAALDAENAAMLGAAQPGGAVQQHLEHALEVELRAADQLEHIGARRLLGPRLGELAGELRDGGLGGGGGLWFGPPTSL